jgi:hypothetical protein
MIGRALTFSANQLRSYGMGFRMKAHQFLLGVTLASAIAGAVLTLAQDKTAEQQVTRSTIQ